MSAGQAYNEEKGGSSTLGEPEYGHDPASGGIFSSDYKRSLGGSIQGNLRIIFLWGVLLLHLGSSLAT
uniref:Uncharacterized protein n=1 Tax=Sphaerodactylus townsendi TaxID=933632 RepID=A0ACB8E524_9SAUR